MRPRIAVAAAGALVVTAALGACTKNTGSSGGNNDDMNRTTTGVIAMDPKDSMGPAPAIDGAKPGGTLRIILENDYEHLDPGRNYTLNATAMGELIYRTLTGFREDGSGKLTLVGDLAESPGKDVNGDCKTWEFKLKKGMKYEDGTEIKAADVNYGIARSFEETISDGATYLQEWLTGKGDFASVYKGPYTTGSDKVPNLDVVDDYTLRFNLPEPHCDMPYAVSMNNSSPVPKAQDTKEKYDDHPFSSGPYKVKEYAKTQHLILERNPNWDPKTDPIRHNYPDGVYVEIGPNPSQATERVLADSGDDAAAVAEDGVPQELVSKVKGDPALMKRAVDAPSGLVWRLSFNMDRVKDLKVRQAAAYAVDKRGILTVAGGDAAGTLTHTVLPPSTIGYKEYADPYDGGPNGNPDKAKELLAGQKPKLVMLVRNADDPYMKWANVAKTSLEKAGFEIVITPIVRNQHNPTVKTRGNEYDLYFEGWQPDWPSAASTIPPLFDGRTLGAMGSKGNNNASYLNDPAVNDEIARISKMPANDAAAEWLKLDEKIQKDDCPGVPLFVNRVFAMDGSKVGGVFSSQAIGQQVYYNAYIK